MDKHERTALIARMVKGFDAMPQWAKNAQTHAMCVPKINPATGQPFASTQEIFEAASDESLQAIADDMKSNGDLPDE